MDHLLGIIIPYRDRADHLRQILPCLRAFIHLPYRVLVVEQCDAKLFNRAKLLNIGYERCTVQHPDVDYFAFHDIDLLPEDADYSYVAAPTQLCHRISKYDYRPQPSESFGGVTLFNREHFRLINGYSNNYWGWGGEDDDCRKRVVFSKLEPSRRHGQFTCLPHAHVGKNNNPCYSSNAAQWHKMKSGAYPFQKEGLNTLQYELVSRELHDSHGGWEQYKVIL